MAMEFLVGTLSSGLVLFSIGVVGIAVLFICAGIWIGVFAIAFIVIFTLTMGTFVLIVTILTGAVLKRVFIFVLSLLFWFCRDLYLYIVRWAQDERNDFFFNICLFARTMAIYVFQIISCPL